MQAFSKARFPWFIALLVLLGISLPFLYAGLLWNNEYQFGGFLLNPLDGFSYLAKMYQGWEGNWRYQMAFSADPGEGVYIQLFYLFLGHVARFLELPLGWVFHAARLISAFILLWMLWRFFSAIIPAMRPRRLAYAVAALGSGLGWLVIPFGGFTSDLWVAETYPFLSAYANPHFSLSLAIVMWLLLALRQRLNLPLGLGIILASTALSVISPFGVILVLLIMGGILALTILLENGWRNLAAYRDRILKIILAVLGGAPLLVYDYWITLSDPVIANWNAQNLTPSPPWWDLLISLSPVLWLALLGVWWVFERTDLSTQSRSGIDRKNGKIALVVWAALGLLLVYIPFSLQRRFMMGLYIPLAGLAALGLEKLVTNNPKRYRLWAVVLFVLIIPTNLIVVLAGVHGARTHDAKLYLSQAESQALDWITKGTDPDALILSSPELGGFTPALTGRRVIYGHPFETINADQEKAAVVDYLSGSMTLAEERLFLAGRGVDYVFYGPREQAFDGELDVGDFSVVFLTGDVTIYQVGE